MASLTHIWRHPIKSHGREALQSVALTKDMTMPWDRAWAVMHEGARLSGEGWASCANFSRGAKAPALMAISATWDETANKITLTHPDRPDITFDPDADSDALISWVKPLMPADRAQSAKLIRATARGMTDSAFPSISLNSRSTHAQVEQQAGTSLAIERWRGNLWIDGLEPWVEFDWIGKTLRIGTTELQVRERITRCLATTANPETGQRDIDTLSALKHFGHQDFGVYAIVTKSGAIRTGDPVTIL